MKAEKIIRAIGSVDDRYLLEAAETPSKKASWKIAVMAAACFVLIGGICLGVFALPGVFSEKSAPMTDAVSAAPPMDGEAFFEAGNVYDNETNGVEDTEQIPMPTEGAEAPTQNERIDQNSSVPAASLSELSATEKGEDGISSEAEASAASDVPPGESIATLEKIEKIGETTWHLSLINQGNEQPFELEVETELFAMPPEQLEEGTSLVILHGEGYEPVQILYAGVAYYGE